MFTRQLEGSTPRKTCVWRYLCLSWKRFTWRTEWICFTLWAGRWPLNRPSRELTYIQILQGDCRSRPFSCLYQGFLPSSLYFAPEPPGGKGHFRYRVLGGATWDKPKYQILPRVIWALGYFDANFFSGVSKCIFSSEQARILNNFYQARRIHFTWVAIWVVLNIFLSLTSYIYHYLWPDSLYCLVIRSLTTRYRGLRSRIVVYPEGARLTHKRLIHLWRARSTVQGSCFPHSESLRTDYGSSPCAQTSA